MALVAPPYPSPPVTQPSQLFRLNKLSRAAFGRPSQFPSSNFSAGPLSPAPAVRGPWCLLPYAVAGLSGPTDIAPHLWPETPGELVLMRIGFPPIFVQHGSEDALLEIARKID